MRTAQLLILTLAATLLARADFSYTMERKSASGATAAGGAETTKTYLKGQKMKVESSNTATVIDFDAQTVTTINQQQRTYTVTPFSEVGQALQQANVNAKVDVQETGQKKTINGYNAGELVMTMAMDAAQAGRAGMAMQIEVDLWLSSDVPGASELRNFYEKNGSRFPWAALVAGGNPGTQSAMAEMQKKLASMGGVPVEEIIRMKPAGSDAQMAQMQARMAPMRAQMEAMIQQGGPQAEILKQQLARMNAMSGGGAMMEITMESKDFSTSAIPDSVFAAPAGYQKTGK